MSSIPLMPQAGNQDLEEGSNPEPGMFTRRIYLSSLSSQACIVDGPRNQRRSTSSWSMLNQPTPTQPLRESDDNDSSRLLYSIYSKIAKEEDNTMVEYCQRISDGTLIFVSPHVSLMVTPHTNWRHRVVYSLPLSVDCSHSQSPTSSQTRKIPPHSTYRTSINFKLPAAQMLLIH